MASNTRRIRYGTKKTTHMRHEENVLDNSTSHPDSDLIYGLCGGGCLGRFIRLALLLDVFTPLSAGPASAVERSLSP